MLCKLEICRYQDFFQPGGKVLPIESSLQIIQKWNVMEHCPDRIHVQSGHHPDDCGIAVRICSRHEVIVIVDLPPCLLDRRGGKPVNAGVQFLRVFQDHPHHLLIRLWQQTAPAVVDRRRRYGLGIIVIEESPVPICRSKLPRNASTTNMSQKYLSSFSGSTYCCF